MNSNELEQKELKSRFFDNAELHFIIFDKDLKVIEVNEALLRYYHRNKSDFLGRHILEIFPDAVDNGIYDKYLSVLKTGNPIIIENSTLNPIYGNQHNRIKAFRVDEGIGATASNITELKNTIEALELFSFRLSHDVNGPLANILSLSNIALAADDDAAQLKSYFGLVKQSVTNLNAILTQVNQTLRIHKGIEHAEEIDFATTVSDVRQSLAYTEGYKSVVFKESIESLVGFYFDKATIVSLFQNLIDNAIKYRKTNCTDAYVHITVENVDEKVKITISDNGIGIAKVKQSKIFTLFYRATESGSGNGIGLYSLRFSLMKLGGHIAFESDEGEGTKFTIYLPNRRAMADVKSMEEC
jgi:signal transduction histidine kinase